MSRTKQEKESAARDRELSVEYRNLASETAPEHLRQEVLRRAALEVGENNRPRFFSNWLRPLAFATTAGLCIAIMLDLSQAPEPEYPYETGISSAPRSDDAASAASGPAAALSRAVEESGRQLRQLDQTVNATSPTESGRHCSEEQSASAEEWWRCIEELRDRGEFAAAQAEFRLFREDFPDFQPLE